MNFTFSFTVFNIIYSTTNLSNIEKIAEFMSDSLKSIHTFSLALALLTMIFAVVRNYTQFGQDLGLKFIASLFCIMVLFFAFPKVSDNLKEKLENFSQPIAEEIDSLHKTLLSTSNNQSYGNINSNVAVKVIKNNDGTYTLGVYIADVSEYVKEGSPLDAEAFTRGTSVYLPDRVIPMLPKELSNGICSLNENVDRLVMACEMKIDNDGHVLEHDIFEGIIALKNIPQRERIPRSG